jgi:beta-xylosidase
MRHAPHNPLVRTQSASEKWWSRGHATLVAGPDDTWWKLYHGYENSFWTLGRQTLLDPVEWTADGWPKALGGDLSRPLRKPKGRPVPHGVALSDDFSTNKFGLVVAPNSNLPSDQAPAYFKPNGTPCGRERFAVHVT